MKKTVLIFALAFGLALVACAESHSPESNFRVEPVDGGASVRIVEYLGDSWEVRIPPRIRGLPVTHIGPGLCCCDGGSNDGGAVFQNLISVTIPNSVTHIGSMAFWDNQLTSVSIPNSVTYIGAGAFYLNQLTSVSIPNSVIYIGREAFANNRLTNVSIPNSITSIEVGVFEFNRLTNVSIPNSVIYIGNGAFYSNQLTSVTIPNSVTYIGLGAFADNQLTSVSIPSDTAITVFHSRMNIWGVYSSFDGNVTITRR